MKRVHQNSKQNALVTFKKNINSILLIAILVASFQNLQAQQQDTAKEYQAFNISGHLKNMHLWHGFMVHSGALFATSLEYNSKNTKFTFGVWGGASFAGNDVWNETTKKYVNANYKEFSIYTSYRFSDNFFMEAVSHNNYTGVEERGDQLHYWSYDKTQGYNFVDIGFGYKLDKNTSVYLATIIGGGSGDYEVQTDGSLKDSYTNYLEVKRKVWEKENAKLSLFVGGAWSFITDKTFYTESAGNVINVGAALNKNIKIANFKLPVEVTAMWNPEKEITVLQLDITLF
ncbi:hypothetical protein SAMN05216503_1529 [Polaribacter sp. KT25b]|uniref:hypothetical protein n=1 Tax=Polaribacter sp. KT25b TaxID=1855336 RepID=UPI00087C5286|nr:hypothetical protein [Polaribacter sp. KT25b]SDR96256.1 hypothetical protein SAMN05216503_1529 [Polaribacter sp. KT25b]